MSKKTLALIVSLVVLTAVLLFIALSTKEQRTATNTPGGGEQVEPTPPAESVLTMTPDTIDLSAGAAGQQTVNVEIETGENQVTAVQLEVGYDPAVIRNVTVTPGTFFDSPTVLLNKTDANTGRISYALGIAPAQDPRSGNGTVATITFTAVPNADVSETEISLLPKSLVTARGVGPSVLKSATGTQVMLPAGATGTSQPTTQTIPTTPTQ